MLFYLFIITMFGTARATIRSPFYFYRFPIRKTHRADRLALFPLAAGITLIRAVWQKMGALIFPRITPSITFYFLILPPICFPL